MVVGNLHAYAPASNSIQPETCTYPFSPPACPVPLSRTSFEPYPHSFLNRIDIIVLSHFQEGSAGNLFPPETTGVDCQAPSIRMTAPLVLRHSGILRCRVNTNKRYPGKRRESNALFPVLPLLYSLYRRQDKSLSPFSVILRRSDSCLDCT